MNQLVAQTNSLNRHIEGSGAANESTNNQDRNPHQMMGQPASSNSQLQAQNMQHHLSADSDELDLDEADYYDQLDDDP